METILPAIIGLGVLVTISRVYSHRDWHLSASSIRYGLMLLVVAGGMTIFWMQSVDRSSSGEADQLSGIIQNDRPTLVMLYSHFCVECVALLPALDDLQAQVDSAELSLDVVTIDIDTPAGRATREAYIFSPPLTFILFDADGVEQSRPVSLPSLDDLRVMLNMEP
jgi:thiol-disulfide isomerase/thioredoxin